MINMLLKLYIIKNLNELKLKISKLKNFRSHRELQLPYKSIIIRQHIRKIYFF
jgi:hypothetical protein